VSENTLLMLNSKARIEQEDTLPGPSFEISVVWGRESWHRLFHYYRLLVTI